jgi:hypothetical protein
LEEDRYPLFGEIALGMDFPEPKGLSRAGTGKPPILPGFEVFENRMIIPQGVKPLRIVPQVLAEPGGIDGMASSLNDAKGTDKGLGIDRIKPGSGGFHEPLKTIGPCMGTDILVGKVYTGNKDIPPGYGKGQI